LKNDIASSFGVGFEVALEQTTIVHPSIDLFEINPCKVVVDGKLPEAP